MITNRITASQARELSTKREDLVLAKVYDSIRYEASPPRYGKSLTMYDVMWSPHNDTACEVCKRLNADGFKVDLAKGEYWLPLAEEATVSNCITITW